MYDSTPLMLKNPKKNRRFFLAVSIFLPQLIDFPRRDFFYSQPDQNKTKTDQWMDRPVNVYKVSDQNLTF